MRAAYEPRLVRIEPDRHHLHLQTFGLKNDTGAGDGKLADPALPEATADHDGLGLLPGFALEEAPGDEGQLLREFLDRTVQHGRSLDIVADQNLVELHLAKVYRGLTAERIVTALFQRLAPRNENVLNRALAGAVAQKAVLVLQFDIVAIDLDRRQPGGSVISDTDHAVLFRHMLSAPEPAMAGQRLRNPMVAWLEMAKMPGIG